ncbi:CD2-associated protein isoform X4 [Hemibagrus wyckioides]|uniref:CD2-associated protein isoform X4 n=1 Tax=Hemibagrus wyckioides TaxID=337641 RepID=UPI00266D2639|nr:CD2-associated protein isoform X4 [Hemibagrus wyckioides]
MVEVVVEFDYEAAHEDELTLRLGDVIKNVRRIEEDGWMEGDLNGRRGLFPDNFVKELRKESKEETKEVKEVKEVKEMKEDAQRRSSGNVASLVQRISTYGIPAGGLGFQPRTSKKKPKKRQCKVLFEYVPQNEDELELKVGDIIEISEEVEEGWWSGIMNGKSGLFPSNFVKEIETNEDGESNDVPEEPEGKDEVSSPISPGNGVIAHPKKIKGVGFGNIFREGSVKLKPRLSDSEEKKERPVPSLPSAPKPSPINTADAHKMEKDGDSKGKLKEYCKATYNYEATNQDELDLKEGDIVHLLSKDTGEPGWWRGELNGRAGVFPDNFVVLIPDSEKETLLSKGSIKQTKPEPEEKPRKPPPPSKSAALKPEVPSTDKKPAQLRPEDKDLMSFDDVSATSEKLSHPTANRPKMPGRRLPAQFSGNQSPNKEVNEKAPKTEEEETPRPKPSEKLSHVTPSSVHKAASFSTPEPKAKTEVDEGKGKEMDELRTQIKELLLSVELLKTQQTRELADLRSELDEERLKRVALQMEIEKLKKQVQST